MKRVHTVYRVIKSQIGGAYAHPIKTYADNKDAESALAQAAADFAAAIEGNVIVKTPQGPRAAMTVKQLLHEMGVSGVSYSILSHDVHEGMILTPTVRLQ